MMMMVIKSNQQKEKKAQRKGKSTVDFTGFPPVNFLCNAVAGKIQSVQCGGGAV